VGSNGEQKKRRGRRTIVGEDRRRRWAAKDGDGELILGEDQRGWREWEGE
jgi:hypothetical protein